ncbi:hypothetical protein AVEN_261834-1 [Araneus ventricosus]|uniref:Uncharacterized protein n=1 Tax=Araneus ventricosus TaxID=182803 RepID=A0A4Y2HTY9_ARAVE|nr:hypothetical protein AVEN_261834-1 [Araneus ventricosus]
MQVGNDNNTSEIVQIQKGSFRTQTAMRKSNSNALVSENSKFRKIVCPQCGDCHLLYQCPRIQKLTVEQPWSLWALEKEILTTKVRKNNSFAEARRLISERSPKPGVAYSSAVKQCAYCGSHATPQGIQKNSPRSNTQPAPVPSDSVQIPNKSSIPEKTLAVAFHPLKDIQTPKQKETVKAADNTDNVKKLQRIKETKAAERSRLAALKKNKDLKNLPLTEGDFLKQLSKTIVEAQNVDQVLEIHPSDEDLMSTASETDVSSSSSKKS